MKTISLKTPSLKTPSTCASPWAPSSSAREQFGIAPNRSQHGTALPFAGSAPVAAYAAAMTQGRPVVLTDDAKVPDPRERTR